MAPDGELPSIKETDIIQNPNRVQAEKFLETYAPSLFNTLKIDENGFKFPKFDFAKGKILSISYDKLSEIDFALTIKFKPKAEDGSPNPYIDYDEYKISGKKQGNQYTYNFHSSLERTYRKLDFEVKPKEITPKNIQLILDAYSPGSYVKDGFRFEDETFMGKITHIECKEKKKSEFGGVAGWELTIQQTRPDGQQATYTLLGDTNKIAESLKIRISKKSDATPGQTTGALKY